MNCNFLKFHQKIRPKKAINEPILIKKLKLAAPKHSFPWYKVLEFLENSKWLRKNVQVCENVTIAKEKKRSLLRNFFCLGDFGAEKNHGGLLEIDTDIELQLNEENQKQEQRTAANV